MVARSDTGHRVLVTGLNGFTGRYLERELRAAGYAVHGLERTGHTATTDTACHAVDLLDAHAVRAAVEHVQPQAVIHLAAVAFVAHDDVDALYRTNIVGTRNLLAALAALPEAPRSVVLASSANVYGDAKAGSVDEDTPPRPLNDYAVSKLSMEWMARTWQARLPITFVRPFNYTGVGQDERYLIPKIVAHFRRRAARIELGNLAVEREFMDVRAVARAYRRLLETRADEDTFNLCCGIGHSLREVLGMMTELTGHAIEVAVNPAFVRAHEIPRLVGDPRRLQARIGELPDHPLIDTLRWMYEAAAD